MSDARLLEIPEYRIEGPDKVTGRAIYAADVRRDGMLHAAFLRSPYAHARIVSIDVEAARRMPGVHAVLTGADVRPARLGRRLQDWPVLAWERVRLIGDRVAAVAAESAAQAEAATGAISVRYEELPAVFEPDAALAPGAPVLHPEPGDYRYLGGERPAVPHPNVQGVARHEHGDVTAGLAGAVHVFEHSFEVARVFPGALEPRASLVWLDGDVIHLISTNKSPFALRDHLSAGLGIPTDRIVVDSGHIGGDFGGKGLSIDEYALTFLARTTGRPVRAVTRYGDEMRATTTRNGGRIHLRTGVDADGRIVAHEAHIVFNGGAYAAGQPNARLVPGEALMTLPGYRVPAASVEAMTVYTNCVPGGNARAPGQPQTAFAAESHLDLIARELRVDPVELRLRNAIRPGDLDVHGERWERSTMVAVLETIRRERRQAPLPPGRGRGIALGARPSPAGRLDATVVLAVTAGAQVELITSISDQGGGAHTMLQRTVAAALGLPIERVAVRRGTTAEVAFDAGIGGSRVTPVVGGAAIAAAAALRERLEVIAPGLPLAGQLDVAARAADVRVTGEHSHRKGVHGTYAYAVEIEVDRETGAIRLVDCLLVVDVGTVINPVALRGQLVGGFVYGLGQAVMEDLRVEDGLVLTANLGDYKMPTIADVPPLRVVLLTEDKGDGPFGAKAVGELTNPAIGPAIANAVHDAVGVRILSLPVTAEKVWRALSR